MSCVVVITNMQTPGGDRQGNVLFDGRNECVVNQKMSYVAVMTNTQMPRASMEKVCCLMAETNMSLLL